VIVYNLRGFHSIGFPSEWGLYGPEGSSKTTLVSIQLVSPASGDSLSIALPRSRHPLSFHSIGFPSEWGHRITRKENLQDLAVSIQLVSPASGDT